MARSHRYLSLFLNLISKVLRSSLSWLILERIVVLLCVRLTLDAMASTWIYALVNYFLEGWFAQSIDQYYIDSFSTLITVTFIFTICGPLFNAILRYRCKMDSFGHALVENYMWTPMFIIFFGGLSMHLSWALLCYLLSIDVQWGSTAKVSSPNFLEFMIRNWKRRIFGRSCRR